MRFAAEIFEPASDVLERLRSRSDDAGVSASGEHSLIIIASDAIQRCDMREARARISARLTDAARDGPSIEPDVRSLEDLFVRLAGARSQMQRTIPAMTAEVS